MDPIMLKLELGLTFEQAELVMAVVQGRKSPKDFVSVCEYVNKCFSDPEQVYLKFLAINEIVGGHGVECIDNFYYVNMGYLFYPTVIYNGSYFFIGVIEDYLS